MNEAEARVLIDRELRERKWQDDLIAREGARTPEQKKALGRKRPDYILYKSGSSRPLAVVEAKRQGKDLQAALQQALGYARAIKCPVAFATDGVVVLSAHASNGEPLILGGEVVRNLLGEQALVNYEFSHIWERGAVLKNSGALISVFKTAAKTLLSEGIANLDAFVEFSQILFFKILSEISEQDSTRSPLPVRWRDLRSLSGVALLDGYKNALKTLDAIYPGVFSMQVEIKNPQTLEKIMDRLDKYAFVEMRTDVKGEAYEHFLRQYNRKKSELAQYFTPRHVVSAMVAICNPHWGETVYDPFCGTGGILVEAFRHLQKQKPSAGSKDADWLKNRSIFGADISRSAAAAKMNMILAGDGHSNIHQCDSLKTPPPRGKYDVVITNIPFVRGLEEKFITHCLNAVAGNRGGRVCMIVPERIIDAAEYADLRAKILREWTVKRVLSLPRELFRGFTNAKTSIIYALWGDGHGNEKADAKRIAVAIPHINIANDGFTLNKRREPLPGRNDLDFAVETRNDALASAHKASEKNGYLLRPPALPPLTAKGDTVPLRKVVKVCERPCTITADMTCKEPGMDGKNHRIFLKEERNGYNVGVTDRYLILRGDLVFAFLHTQNGLFAYCEEELLHSTGSHLVCRVQEDKVDRDYLFWVLHAVIPTLSMSDTTGREKYDDDDILNLPIPLPSLKAQRQSVARVRTASSKLAKAKEGAEAALAEFVDGNFIKN